MQGRIGRMTLSDALTGKDIPEEIRANLVLIGVPYLSFEGVVEEGHLVVHTDLADEVETIFTLLLTEKFPLEKVVPVNAYEWGDERSMRDNNTSCFNYRLVADTFFVSNHSLGRAIDINPRLNPQFANGKTYPSTGTYDTQVPGTITAGSAPVRIFEAYGWEWGGRWSERTDYQHFQKPPTSDSATV